MFGYRHTIVRLRGAGHLAGPAGGAGVGPAPLHETAHQTNAVAVAAGGRYSLPDGIEVADGFAALAAFGSSFGRLRQQTASRRRDSLRHGRHGSGAPAGARRNTLHGGGPSRLAVALFAARPRPPAACPR